MSSSIRTPVHIHEKREVSSWQHSAEGAMVGMNHSRGRRWSIARPKPTAPAMMLAR